MRQTNPILKFYSNRPNFYDIDASVKIDEISTKIDEILKVLFEESVLPNSQKQA